MPEDLDRPADVVNHGQLPDKRIGFFGSYAHSIDAKGRIIIPNAYREALGETFSMGPTRDFNGVALYPNDEFDRILDELNAMNQRKPFVQNYTVQFYKLSYRDMQADSQGRLLAQAKPLRAGDPSIRAIDARNAFLMDSLMREVVRSGTATRAKSLKRSDIAGKTGTTNDSHDAWFAGYQPRIAAVAWVGFDQPRKLGDRETGGGLALPIWVDYMSRALRNVPESPMSPPEGIVEVNGEYYYAETRPGQGVPSLGVTEDGVATGENAEQIRNQVF